MTQNLVSEGRGTGEPGGKQGAIFVCVYPYLDMLLYFPRDPKTLPPIIIHAENHICVSRSQAFMLQFYVKTWFLEFEFQIFVEKVPAPLNEDHFQLVDNLPSIYFV